MAVCPSPALPVHHAGGLQSAPTPQTAGKAGWHGRHIARWQINFRLTEIWDLSPHSGSGSRQKALGWDQHASGRRALPFRERPARLVGRPDAWRAVPLAARPLAPLERRCRRITWHSRATAFHRPRDGKAGGAVEKSGRGRDGEGGDYDGERWPQKKGLLFRP